MSGCEPEAMTGWIPSKIHLYQAAKLTGCNDSLRFGLRHLAGAFENSMPLTQFDLMLPLRKRLVVFCLRTAGTVNWKRAALEVSWLRTLRPEASCYTFVIDPRTAARLNAEIAKAGCGHLIKAVAATSEQFVELISQLARDSRPSPKGASADRPLH